MLRRCSLTLNSMVRQACKNNNKCHNNRNLFWTVGTHVRAYSGKRRRVKVVLLDNDVSKKGVSGEVIDVRPGYARNFLIPRKLAKYATPENVALYGSVSETDTQEVDGVVEQGTTEEIAQSGNVGEDEEITEIEAAVA